jgi:hypothetical protein
MDNQTKNDSNELSDNQSKKEIKIDPLLEPVIVDEEDVPKHYQIIAYQKRFTTWELWKDWIQRTGYDIYYRIRWIYLYGWK